MEILKYQAQRLWQTFKMQYQNQCAFLKSTPWPRNASHSHQNIHLTWPGPKFPLAAEPVVQIALRIRLQYASQQKSTTEPDF